MSGTLMSGVFITHNNHVEVIGKCIITNESVSFNVPKENFYNWKFGNMKIQDAIPDLPELHREFLISGVGSEEGWNQLFNE